MYKLLIVDDEAEVVEGLAELPNWPSYHISEVLCAYNGKEAMEVIERFEPDIVLTDISMPYMSGLKLAEWIKEHYPLIKVIIISGYDDFSYAQQAIALHVVEYVLKPFSDAQCMEAVKNVVIALELEREAFINLQQLKVHYHTTLPILREKFLSSLMTRQLASSVIVERAQKHNIDLYGDGYIVAVLSIYESVSITFSEDFDLQLFALTNVAAELWKQAFAGEVFIHQEEIILLGVNKSDTKEQFIASVRQQLVNMIRSIEKYLKLKSTISIGRYKLEPSDIQKSYRSALAGLEYRKILEETSLICIDDIEQDQRPKLIFDDQKEQLLIRTLKLGQRDELIQVLNQLVEEPLRQEGHIAVDSQYMFDVVIALQRFIKTLDEATIIDLPYQTSLIQHYETLSSLEKTKTWLYHLCYSLQEQIASHRHHHSIKLIESTYLYTEQHYADSDLSVQKISQYFHLSSGYFSALFKRATGMSYGNYLLKYRMTLAQEWLLTTELKAFEIAERLGFSDPNYFSLTFKKYTGMSAKEYRAKDG